MITIRVRVRVRFRARVRVRVGVRADTHPNLQTLSLLTGRRCAARRLRVEVGVRADTNPNPKPPNRKAVRSAESYDAKTSRTSTSRSALRDRR